jgi:Large polyvalent protein-associated domain 7
MDNDESSPSRSPARSGPTGTTPAAGGAVEPANRATVAKEKFQTPLDQLNPTGPRFELRDPFAEVTYRATTFSEMVAKADQLDSNRFTAIDAHGQRSTVQKLNGQWPKERSRESEPDPKTESPIRGDASQAKLRATNVVPLSKSPTQAEPTDTKLLATIDAKAERAAQIDRLETELSDRYLIKRTPVTVGDVSIGRTEYRFRGDTTRVAFTESTFRLATDTNSPSVARSMVDVAQTRGWRALRVSGNEDFKRMVWLEASVRGVKALGYEPRPGDLDVLQKAREARLTNRIEQDRNAAGYSGKDPAKEAATYPTSRAASSATSTTTKPTTAAPEKASVRGGGGRKAVLVAIEAVLVAKGVPDKQRAAVMAAATEQLAQRLRDGQSLKVKVYDKAAPSQRPVVVPTPEVQRSRERAAQVR